MRRCLVVAATVALVLTTLATPAAASDPARRPRGDEPLPGYTIDNPPLAPLVVDGRRTRVYQGVHRHAAYDIEVPARWNGELVMYAHGYRGNGTVLTVDPPPFGLRQRLVSQGYAWAASSYYANGYDVRAGVRSTRQLARHFRKVVERPRRTYLIGVSMGGHVTGRSLEQYPRFYDGALPMCGVLGDSELFDFFLDYNVVAQDLADVPAYPPPADYVTADVPLIASALGLTGLVPGGPDTTTELGAQFRSIVIERSGGDRPGGQQSFAVWKDFLFGLWQPDDGGTLAQNPGRLATNESTIYMPTVPVDVNPSVQRVPPADPVARRTARLTASPQIFGRPRVPVLSLHNLGDLFVPFSMEQIYARDVAANHRSRLVVQRAIRAAGHCEFSAAEAGRAWDDLVAWTRRGNRPRGDAVTDPSAVARPNFGCRFSDPTAYATGSRPLYAPCP